MESIGLKNYTSCLEDLVESIDRTNKIIALHISEAEPDRLAVEGYEKFRKQLIKEFNELLGRLNLEVRYKNRRVKVA